MKKLLLISFLIISLPVFAEVYNVYNQDNYRIAQEESERTLFILDFSNSMSEYLDGQSKVDMMLDTMRKLLPSLNPRSFIGLRVYGHKMGFTPFDSCRTSSLLVPITTSNAAAIDGALAKTHPRGMTPITYSLKQAVKYDFMGFPGKKHIILLTDGGENCDESPCKFVMELIKDSDSIASLLTGSNQTVILKAMSLLKSMGQLTEEYKQTGIANITDENIKSVAIAL